jgi:hypothetical protein
LGSIQNNSFLNFQIIEFRGKRRNMNKNFSLFLSQLPYVSDEEQKDIEEHFGSPSDYDTADFVDMTDWVKNEVSLE